MTGWRWFWKRSEEPKTSSDVDCLVNERDDQALGYHNSWLVYHASDTNKLLQVTSKGGGKTADADAIPLIWYILLDIHHQFSICPYGDKGYKSYTWEGRPVAVARLC